MKTIKEGIMSPEQGSEEKWKFSDLLADQKVQERWEKVRKYFYLRESTYDMTNRCNLQCEGCYYYAGQKQFVRENGDPLAWQKLLQGEKERGITYVVLAGAEPSLVPDLLEVCYQEIPFGCIATNGLRKVPETVDYRIHISVWGNDETSFMVRKARHMLLKQIENYRDDPRAVFVYTFTGENIEEAHEVAEKLGQSGCKMTFNTFSSTVGYNGALRHDGESLSHARKVMLELLEHYPETVLSSPYHIVAHTHKFGLQDLYGCSYPRRNPSTDIGLGRSFRQYWADLTWNRALACCVPDTDCEDCRHYAAGSAVVTARLMRHVNNPDTFKSWLDYVDTYLAVWVSGYNKGENLKTRMVAPPGFKLWDY